MKAQADEDIRDKTLRELEVDIRRRPSEQLVVVFLGPETSNEVQRAMEEVSIQLGRAYRAQHRSETLSGALVGFVVGLVAGLLMAKIL